MRSSSSRTRQVSFVNGAINQPKQTTFGNDNEIDKILKMAEYYTRQFADLQYRISSGNKQDELNEDTMSRTSLDSFNSDAQFEFYGVPTCFPKNKHLHPHQHESLKWMSILYHSEVNGILADDMGMGKTVQAVSFLAYLHQYHGVREPHLIVAPKSTIPNWMNELKEFAPFFRVVNLIPTKDLRDDILENQMQEGNYDVCVTTYEAIQICETQLMKKEFHAVFFDEAHKLKNDQSKISQKSRNLFSRTRILLTGTPLQNDLGELWSLLNFLMPDLFQSKKSFVDQFNFDAKDDSEKIEQVKILHKILKPFMLRRTKDQFVIKLPDKIEINMQVPLSQLQMEMYASILTGKEGISSMLYSNDLSKSFNPKQLHNILMQLRKVCNHPYLFPGVEPEGSEVFGEHLVEASGKLRVVDKLLKKITSQNEQTLIFSQFTKTLDVIDDYCQLRGWKYSRLDGNTSFDDRSQVLREFVRPGTEQQLFLISTRAGGLGLNLFSANHVIIFDSDWNPQIDLQAMDRAHRIGQKKKVYVYRLITEGSIEEKIIERQAIKLKYDQVIIQEGSKPLNSSLSKSEYERMIFHGAAKIMQMKEERVKISNGDSQTTETQQKEEDIDIDSLIQEGEKRHYHLKEQTEQSMTDEKQGVFDFKLEQIDSLIFQDKDFREEQKKVKEILKEQATRRVEQQKQQRQRRQKIYAIDAIDAIEVSQTNALEEKLEKKKEWKPIKEKPVYDFHFDQFFDWSKQEFKQFVESFQKNEADDYESIANDIESKSAEEVKEYMQVFLERYTELSIKNTLFSRMLYNNFQKENEQTFLNYEKYKDYHVLLPNNSKTDREGFMYLLQDKYNKLQGQKSTQLPLELRMDHSFKSQSKELNEEILKAVAIALRGEETLREVVAPVYEYHRTLENQLNEVERFRKHFDQDKKLKNKPSQTKSSLKSSQIQKKEKPKNTQVEEDMSTAYTSSKASPLLTKQNKSKKTLAVEDTISSEELNKMKDALKSKLNQKNKKKTKENQQEIDQMFQVDRSKSNKLRV